MKKDENTSGERGLKVVATLFPVYDFARNIGGETADVSLLLPPGVESHGFEPRPGDILKIKNADIFIYTGRFMEPWAEDIIRGTDNKNLLIVDSSNGITLQKEAEENRQGKKIDPHIWLDLSNSEKMVDNILDGFIKKDHLHKDLFMKNANDYKAKLQDLDSRFKKTFSRCRKNIFIHGGHFAFGYFARRYGLEYISAYKGFSPDSEPSPRHLAELIKKMNRYDIRHVYYEELITPRVAMTIAKETGAIPLELNGGHNISKDDMDKGITFLSIMEKNLENLKTGLQCQ